MAIITVFAFLLILCCRFIYSICALIISRLFMGRNPSILFFDPEAVKQITIKDFNSFIDRRVSILCIWTHFVTLQNMGNCHVNILIRVIPHYREHFKSQIFPYALSLKPIPIDGTPLYCNN